VTVNPTFYVIVNPVAVNLTVNSTNFPVTVKPTFPVTVKPFSVTLSSFPVTVNPTLKATIFFSL